MGTIRDFVLLGEKHRELLDSLRGTYLSPLASLHSSLTADLSRTFDSLRLKNFAMEMEAVAARLRDVHMSTVDRFNEGMRHFEMVERIKEQVAALNIPPIKIPPIIESIAAYPPISPLLGIARSFPTVSDIDWKDDDEVVLRERVTQLEAQVRELQAQSNPSQPPEPPDDPTLHTGQYL